ncbi:MAG: aldehyde dehydrogenase family protein [Nanoarchaeota archaeon]|nr:aldehyde dehydrogenase family protein [Nanoarchaeota archaeon]MBU1704836.1 aldehyde dehydrogenase family protein [Nanoarchaeota archaeon]
MKHINPATLESTDIKETPISSIRSIVAKAKLSQQSWSKLTVKERVTEIRKLSGLIRQDAKTIAETITSDMGKPISQSKGEVEHAIEQINFFCNKSEQWLAPEDNVHFDPLGVVAVISPWNYPLNTPFSSIIPALLCGNAVIHKPSEFTPKVGIEIDKLLIGLPFFTITGGKKHGEALVKEDIQMVSFTGSTATGKKIMKDSADKLHRLVLELGGLDAAIVLKDIDIKKTAADIVKRNARNSGQVCCSIKRVFVEEPIFQEFVDEAVKASKKLTIGDPMTYPDMGPVVAEFQLKKIKGAIKDAVQKGAKVLTGGKAKGLFFPQTIIVDVKPEMELMHEEPFGPILPIVSVKYYKEAIKQANNTDYGLTGSVWTNNKKLAIDIAKQLQVGVVNINSHGSCGMGNPWGGAKCSGIGRQDNKEGFRAFTEMKYIRV